MDSDKSLAKPDEDKKKRFPGGRFGLSLLGFGAVNAAIIAGVIAWNWTYPGGNIADDVLTNNLQQSPSYGTWSWWAAHSYFGEKKDPEVVITGSSLVNCPVWSCDAVMMNKDIDCVVHHRSLTLEKFLKEKMPGFEPTVVNISVQGATSCDYYMMTRGLMSGKRKPKVLVVGVAPRDFIDNKLKNLGDTEPFMFHQRYVDFDDTVARAYSNPYNRAMGELECKIARMPLRRFHAAVASYFNDDSGAENTKRAVAGDELHFAISTESLRVFPGDLIVKKVIPEVFHDNTAEYASRYKNPHPEQFATQIFFFEEMLKRMKAQGVQVLVVDMPTMKQNRAMLPIAFWNNYRTQMKAVCAKQDAQYLYLSDNPEFVQRDYIDTVHLNFRGGAKLIKKIADAIATRPQLASAIEGNTPQNPKHQISAKESVNQ